jgi:hypothetical protein
MSRFPTAVQGGPSRRGGIVAYRTAGRDSGVSMVEWGAALFLIAAILVALAAATLPRTVTDGVVSAICKVFTAGTGDCAIPGEGSEGDPNEAFRPDSCDAATSVRSGEASLAVSIPETPIQVRVAEDLVFTQTTNSEGQVTVTAVNGQSGGVQIASPEGPAGEGNNVSGSAGVNLRLAAGDGWIFENQEEADEFLDDIRRRAIAEAVVPGPSGFGDWAMDRIEDVGDAVGAEGIVDDLIGDVPDPDIQRNELEINANAGFTAALGNITPGVEVNDGQPQVGLDPNTARAYVSIDGRARVIREENEEQGTTSDTFQIRGGARAGYDTRYTDNEEARAIAEGAVRLTRNEDGELVSLTLQQTSIINGRATVTTTELPLETDRERRIVQENLGGVVERGAQTLQLTWDDMAPTGDPGPNASPLQRLLYDQGRTHRVNYDYDSETTPYDTGTPVVTGGFTYVSADQEVRDAEYLGAPTQAGRPWLDFPQCHN